MSDMSPGTHRLEEGAFDPRLREEVEAVFWLFEQVRSGQPLPVVEAEAVVHSLYISTRLDSDSAVEQLPLQNMEEYNAVHEINVAMLAMGAAESMNMEERSVRAVGLAGLLHDIGMVRVPVAMIAKAEQLSGDERAIVTRHPLEGARIIIESDAALELAAVVAYEHHVKPDGSGYPVFTYPRAPHSVSKLIAVCDTYHALRSPRPFREAWPPDIVFSFLQQRSGFDFDPDMVDVVTRMMRSVEKTRVQGS